ncbi:hypothetical protein GM708_04060 [Vibrio cholerae]|nr:hypothetical protein [Vibrio cholerae]
MDAVALIGTLAAWVVMAGAAALTAWRVDGAWRRGADADDYFWLVFGGAVVVVGAGVAAGSFGSAWSAVTVGIATSGAASAWVWWRHRQRRMLAARTAQENAWAELCRRHDAVVRRWADYDVDLSKAIAYPAMHRPGDPATRPVVLALREAAAERAVAADGVPDGGHADRYRAAVVHLERAFGAAEQDVIARESRRGARHRAVSG